MLAIILPGGLASIAAFIVIAAALAAIVFVACKAMGVAIPAWVIQIFWIVIIAVVCIVAIRFVAGL